MTADNSRPSVLGRGGQRGGRLNGAPVAPPKDFFKTMARLWSHFNLEHFQIGLVASFALITSGCGLAVPYLVGRAIDSLAAQGGVHFDSLTSLLFALGAAYLIDASLSIIQGWTIAQVSQRIVTKLRLALFSKVQKLPLTFFDQRSHGDLMSRLTNDIDNISGTIAQSGVQMIASGLLISGALVMMLVLSPLLTAAALIILPLAIGLSRTIARQVRRLFRDQQQTLGALNGHIEETISGFLEVQVFNRQPAVIDHFDALNKRLSKISVRAQIWSGFLMPIMNVINNLGFTAIAATGGLLAIHGLASIGLIASFIAYSRLFGRPLTELANTYNSFQTALAGAERVFEILDLAEEPTDSPQAIVLTKPAGAINFSQVSFDYSADRPVLREIDFAVPAGTLTAIIGPTGGGKTTIVNLLTRMYEIDRGAIQIDGHDLRNLRRTSLRQAFSVVLQDTYLFSGSLRQNIGYGNQQASLAQIQQAARLAHADDFIQKLPAGYDQVVKDGGANLSQGQRQLIAIARAVLSDAPILILDEATSNIDTQTEVLIQAALTKLMKNRTSVVIAHRLQTIRNADLILVVDQGRIVERGNHQTLLDQQGYYYQMHQLYH